MKLFNRYGYCILHTGSTIFHGSKAQQGNDAIFYCFHPSEAIGWSESDSVEVWRAKRDIKLLFMISKLNSTSHTHSATVEIYNELLAENISDSLAPKHFPLRADFIKKLGQYGISGWLTSIEEGVELEVCLFKDNFFDESIEHVTSINKDEYNYVNYRSALKDMSIEPHLDFYKSTATECKGRAFQDFKDYRKWMRASITHEVKVGMGTRKQRENFHHNLRMKFEI